MSGPGFLLIVIALAFLWLALVRPQKRRQQAQAQMWNAIVEGQEIVTAGGIYGEVTGFAGEDVLVRIAPELEVRVARRAIAGVVEPPDDPADEAADEPGPAEESSSEGGSYPEDPR